MPDEPLADVHERGLEALLDLLPDSVAFVDRSGRVVLTNRRAELPDQTLCVRMTDPADAFKIFRPDGRPYDTEDWPVLRSVRTGEVIVDEEFFRLAPDGTRRSFSCRCSPFHHDRERIAGAVLVARDITAQKRSQDQLAYLRAMLDHTEDGIVAFDPQVTGYLAIHRDITERKWAEESLRYHASLLDNIEDGVIATDAEDFRITAWNRGAERLYGFSGEEVLGRPAREVASFPGDQARLRLEAELLETGRSRVEFEARHKDGSPVEVELFAVAVLDERGETTGYLGIHRDITERKRSEERLAYQARLLENIADAVLATDAEFVLTAWNRGAEQMFGWTAQEAIGQRIDELIPTSLSDEEMAAELGDLAKTGSWRGEATWCGKHGKPVIAEGLTVALRSDRGQTSGYVCIMRDLTEPQQDRTALEARARQQALLSDLTLRTLANGDLQVLMHDAVAVVAQSLELEMATVGELLPNGEGVAWRGAFGWSEEAIARLPPSPANARSLVGCTLLVGEPVISVAVRADQRFRISQLFAAQNPASAVAVIIPGEKERFGVLSAASRQRRTFSSENVDFLQAVANVIGVAVERSRVAERMEEERESLRRRIASDLHDEALRELADALALATKARLLAPGPDDAQRWATQIASIQRAVRQLRSAVYDLRLTVDEDRPLADLVRDLVANQAGLAPDSRVELRGAECLPGVSLGHRGTEILRILREAITNARRHSGATTIDVDASGSGADMLQLQVSDNGDWPDREPVVSVRRSTGLAGMLDRAERLGAELTIEGRREGGTDVTLAVALVSAGPREPL
ncbi:MAG: PAS domain S-box protein [Solirubrobacteraceae bacterium]